MCPLKYSYFLKSVSGKMYNMTLLEQEVHAYDPSPFKWKILTALN